VYIFMSVLLKLAHLALKLLSQSYTVRRGEAEVAAATDKFSNEDQFFTTGTCVVLSGAADRGFISHSGAVAEFSVDVRVVITYRCVYVRAT
jgi:hypothetical protein